MIIVYVFFLFTLFDLVVRGGLYHSSVTDNRSCITQFRTLLSVSSRCCDPRWLRSTLGQTDYILFTIPINKLHVVTFGVLRIFLVIMPYYIFTIQKMQVWAVELGPMGIR